MPKHIQPNGPRGATRQRADFAGSLGTGRISARAASRKACGGQHHGAIRSFPHWDQGRKYAPAKCITNSEADPWGRAGIEDHAIARYRRKLRAYAIQRNTEA